MDDDDLGGRLAALEARVAALERPAAPATPHPPSPDPERFWALEVLRGRTGPPFEAGDVAGSILFAGVASTPGAGSVIWQEEHPLPPALEADWHAAAATLSALAHPIRLELVRRLLAGAHTTQELAEIPELGTSGQLYHHLRELQGAGLVVQRRRNHYAVPAERVVPCLVLVAAALSGGRVEAVA